MMHTTFKLPVDIGNWTTAEEVIKIYIDLVTRLKKKIFSFGLG